MTPKTSFGNYQSEFNIAYTKIHVTFFYFMLDISIVSIYYYHVLESNTNICMFPGGARNMGNMAVTFENNTQCSACQKNINNASTMPSYPN